MSVAKLSRIQRNQQEVAGPTPTRQWPTMRAEAFHGLAGEYVQMIDPHTEADPSAVLVQFLVMLGNLVGRGPHFCVEADKHYLNLFAVLVGASAKGRKGVSARQAKRLLLNVDRAWCETRVQDGLSSGEGLIWAVRNPDDQTDGSRDTTVDKRLLILAGEFASVLQALRRHGNILSATIRNAWDTGDLRTMTKNSPLQATGAHISIVGHITRDELLRYLDSTEAGNGFGNRFLWCCVKRSKALPEGGNADTLDFGPLTQKLKRVVDQARNTGELRRNAEAKRLWAKVYPELSEGKPGLLGAMIARGEAQAMRLACLYAVLDQSDVVAAEHILAALALWEYCEESARWIFGQALGDPVADEILRALRDSPDGLTRTQIRDLQGRHGGKSIPRALELLLEQGLVTSEKEGTDGRPVERWRARPASPRSASGTRTLLSLKSLWSHSDLSHPGQSNLSSSDCDISDKSDRRSSCGEEDSGASSDNSDNSDQRPSQVVEERQSERVASEATERQQLLFAKGVP